MSFTFTRTALAMTIAATTGTAFADTLSLQEETVVTATRTAQTLDKTLAPVEVMTAEDIARLQVVDMGSLLARMTSVSVKSSGGRGSNVGISVRGANTGQLLVLVDGVRIGSATLGEASLQHIDPASIERVELVRGPRSSLYGSDAIGGVLQIFTRKGAEQSGGSIRVGAGSHNESDIHVQGTLRGDSAWLMAQLGHTETEGFDRTYVETSGNDDDDAYRNTSVVLDAGYEFSEKVILSANYQHNEGETEFDNIFCISDCQPYSEFKLDAFNTKLQTQWNDAFSTDFTAGYNRDEFTEKDDLSENIDPDSFKTTREFYDIQNDYAFNEGNIITLGVDYFNDEVEASNTEYLETERDNVGIYAQYQSSFGRNSLVLGARNDDNEQYGNENTGNIAYGFNFTDSLKLVASWGTAFKAPTFNDLYYQSPWGSNGNPNLVPETSENIDLGLKYNSGNFSAEIIGFQNNVEDLIEWAPTAPGSWIWTPMNVSEAEIQGVETSVAAPVLGWDLAANYTWLNPEDEGTGNDLRYRPNNSFNLSLDNRWGDFSLGFSVRAQDNVYTDKANDTELAGFGLLDIRAAYQVTENLNVQLKVDNALDKEYQTNDRYREDGTNGMLSMTYSM